jgi:hypothetical protein
MREPDAISSANHLCVRESRTATIVVNLLQRTIDQQEPGTNTVAFFAISDTD